MGKYKSFHIKGAVLDRFGLQQYMEKIASDHMLQNKSERKTYPIPTLNENFKMITKVYYLLKEHVKLGIYIHPAGEWLLDNYYIIEETVKKTSRELSYTKYKKFLKLVNGPYQGYARIYVLAAEIVAYTGSKIEEENLKLVLQSYQNKKQLNMEEIWSIGLFLQIALVQNIRQVCEKIYFAQMQKYKVENMIERLVENKAEKKFKGKSIWDTPVNMRKTPLQFKQPSTGELRYPFIEYMSYRLKRMGRIAIPYLEVLEEQVEKTGTTISEVIRKEHFDIALSKVEIGEAVKSMKNLLKTNFYSIFEDINGVEKILKQDPSEVYSNMDYRTKDIYRNKIKELSKKTRISEIYIANKILELSRQYKKIYDAENKEDLEKYKKTHIGYFILNDQNELLQSLQRKFHN